ncbi:MAG: alpha-amylase family glycosyl hydrolase, partial [Saprospiraceae bacterium]
MSKKISLSLLFCFALSVASRAQDADFMMQAWYWDYFQNGNFATWINNLNAKATELDDAGFKHIWLPPLSRSSTTNNISNGYNPMDLYDLGEFGPACSWGTRAQLNTLIANYNSKGLNVISDMIYNHRDGGKPERNEAVRYYVTTPGTANPYPSDRFYCILPLGSANPGNNGAGDYYIKVSSKVQNNGIYGPYQYRFYARTNNSAVSGVNVNETEPNGGSDCGQPTNNYTLGQGVIATLYDYNGCYTDEFKITLTAGNFNPVDDTLFIYLNNYNSGYADQYAYGLYSIPRSSDIVNELQYWTYSNYNGLPSGQGGMNYNGFRPNDNTANMGGVTESLGCDWNCPLFFYDYDQDQAVTQTVLNAWTQWEIQTVGVKGLRMDAVKNFDPAYVSVLMNHLYTTGATPQFVVGEYFDYNPGSLAGWVNSVTNGMSAGAQGAIKVRAFDFALRNTLREVCDFGSDARNIFTGGMVNGGGANSYNVVTFVDNHDLRKDGLGINNEAMLAYAYILTNNQIGAPCVFYPDYYGVQVGTTPLINLKSRINKLMSLHQSYIYGSTEADYLSRYSTPYGQFFVPGTNGGPETSLIYQLKPSGSGKNVIVAVNFSQNALDMYQHINTGWGATAGTTFTDMLGYSGATLTNITNNNEIHVTLPARSYTVYVQGVNTPLPVELLDFQANPEASTVLLNWRTATERNFDRYEVERSTGDASHFVRIGEKAG